MNQEGLHLGVPMVQVQQGRSGPPAAPQAQPSALSPLLPRLPMQDDSGVGQVLEQYSIPILIVCVLITGVVMTIAFREEIQRRFDSMQQLVLGGGGAKGGAHEQDGAQGAQDANTPFSDDRRATERQRRLEVYRDQMAKEAGLQVEASQKLRQAMNKLNRPPAFQPAQSLAPTRPVVPARPASPPAHPPARPAPPPAQLAIAVAAAPKVRRPSPHSDASPHVAPTDGTVVVTADKFRDLNRMSKAMQQVDGEIAASAPQTAGGGEGKSVNMPEQAVLSSAQSIANQFIISSPADVLTRDAAAAKTTHVGTHVTAEVRVDAVAEVDGGKAAAKAAGRAAGKSAANAAGKAVAAAVTEALNNMAAATVTATDGVPANKTEAVPANKTEAATEDEAADEAEADAGEAATEDEAADEAEADAGEVAVVTVEVADEGDGVKLEAVEVAGDDEAAPEACVGLEDEELTAILVQKQRVQELLKSLHDTNGGAVADGGEGEAAAAVGGDDDGA